MKNIKSLFSSLINQLKKLKKLKKRWWFLIIVVLAIIGWRAWSATAAKNLSATQSMVVVVERRDLIKTLIRSGKVELQGVFQVTPKISGVVAQLKVSNGQKVKTGEKLFMIKSDADAAEKSSAYASFLSAKNSFEEAKNNIGNTEWINFEQTLNALVQTEDKVKKFKEEHPDRLTVDDVEYQTLLTELSVAKRRIEMATLEPSMADQRLKAARAAFNAAQATYQNTLDANYLSPINGTVENLSVNEGEKVVAGVGDKSGTPLFLIIPEGKKTISMQVGLRDVNLLHVGQTALVKDKILKDKEFSATISRIDKVGTKSESGSGLNFRVLLEIDQEDNELSYGNAVEIEIEVDKRENVLTLPSSVVIDNQVTITNEKKEKLEVRTVETGLKAGGEVEILDGLSEGEMVLEEFDY